MNIQITNRDLEVFQTLEKLPFTTEQLFRCSRTFQSPFFCQRILERRLKRLSDEKFLRRCFFAFPRQGRNPAYWRLTRKSFQLVHAGNKPSKPSLFRPIGVALHFHAYHLNEFLLELVLAAGGSQITIDKLDLEKSLSVDENISITPDAVVQLSTRKGKRFTYFIELDTATERVATDQSIPSSIQKKLETYQRHRQLVGNSFRVLFVTTSSLKRTENILKFAQALRSNPASELIYAAYLPSVLESNNCLSSRSFMNPQGQLVSLLQ